ncbi:hypothetical protein FB451DRAFT_1177005 [Mycena latifolia]|nr:hypothetical protein FB451DRAFT_1177005 [Mycena latifolia]
MSMRLPSTPLPGSERLNEISIHSVRVVSARVWGQFYTTSSTRQGCHRWSRSGLVFEMQNESIKVHCKRHRVAVTDAFQGSMSRKIVQCPRDQVHRYPQRAVAPLRLVTHGTIQIPALSKRVLAQHVRCERKAADRITATSLLDPPMHGVLDNGPVMSMNAVSMKRRLWHSSPPHFQLGKSGKSPAYTHNKTTSLASHGRGQVNWKDVCCINYDLGMQIHRRPGSPYMK